jgi:hypothetical protein
MKNHSYSVDRSPCRGDPQIPVDRETNQLVARVSRLYAEASAQDQLALRVWMRDVILGRKTGKTSVVRSRRMEKRATEACERRIMEFPVGMNARDVAKQLKREGWYARASEYAQIVMRIERVRAKAANVQNAAGNV